MSKILPHDYPKTRVIKVPTYIHNLLNALLAEARAERTEKGFIGLADLLHYMIEKFVIEESRFDEVVDYFKTVKRKDWVDFSDNREQQFFKKFKLRTKKSLGGLRRLPTTS